MIVKEGAMTLPECIEDLRLLADYVFDKAVEAPEEYNADGLLDHMTRLAGELRRVATTLENLDLEERAA